MTSRNVAFLQATLNTKCHTTGDQGSELFEILAIDTGGESQGRVDDTGIQGEKVLRNLRAPRVFAVEGADEDGPFAPRVELIVDGALRIDGGGVLLQKGLSTRQGRKKRKQAPETHGNRGVDLGAQTVFENESALERALDDDEEFARPRMGMSGVDT